MFFLLPVIAFGQRLQIENTYGREVRRLAVDTLFAVPADTFSVPAAYNTYPFIARKANSLYVYNTTTHFWQLVTAASTGWLLTGNAGTVDGTNFIGTTDNVPFTIRVNNLKSGYIGTTSHNTGFGYETLKSITTGTENLAFGWGALKNITTGNWNVGIGYSALNSLSGSSYQNIAIGGLAMGIASGVCTNNLAIGTNAGFSMTGSSNNAIVGDYSTWQQTTGNYTTAVGTQSLFNSTTGSNNIAIGYAAGYFNTTGSNQIFINSIYRNNYLGDTTESPIWVLQNATVASQIGRAHV